MNHTRRNIRRINFKILDELKRTDKGRSLNPSKTVNKEVYSRGGKREKKTLRVLYI